MKQRIFFDMDGTIVEFKQGKTIEEITEAGYFKKLLPIESMLTAARHIAAEGTYEVFILSHYMTEQAKADKNQWMNNFFPEVDAAHRIFVPYGMDKSEMLPKPKMSNDILIDDLSLNLHKWKGVGIKVLNGINGTKKTWKGYTVSANSNPNIIAATIKALAEVEAKKPNRMITF